MYKFVCMLGVFRFWYKDVPGHSLSGMCEIPAKYSSSLHGVKFCEERRCDIYEVESAAAVAQRDPAGLARQRSTAALELDRGWISSSAKGGSASSKGQQDAAAPL